MSERDDDGQALTAVLSDTGPTFPGTLRDWFAGQALAGLLASPNTDTSTTNRHMAVVAHGLADAMLAERAKVERGQAPDEPAAEGRTDHAASPAPASVPHCLNCGLVLDSDRDYCLVCGCEAWLFSQRESDIKCTLRAGHDGDHLNGAVSWGGSS